MRLIPRPRLYGLKISAGVYFILGILLAFGGGLGAFFLTMMTGNFIYTPLFLLLPVGMWLGNRYDRPGEKAMLYLPGFSFKKPDPIAEIKSLKEEISRTCNILESDDPYKSALEAKYEGLCELQKALEDDRERQKITAHVNRIERRVSKLLKD